MAGDPHIPGPAASGPGPAPVTRHATGFGHRLGWGRRPALLLIDVVRAYFTPGSPFDLGTTEAVDGCARLLRQARAAGVPVVHTTVRHGADGADAGLFAAKVPALEIFRAGRPGGLADTMPAVAPRPGEVVVVKQYASAFCGTSLSATLVSLGVDTVVIGGVSTSGCVRASATDALQLGFRPMVVRQACGDRTAAVQEANLFDLDAKYADVVDEDEALAHLVPGGTPG